MRRTTLLATTALAALALPPAARAGDGLIFAEVPAPATHAAKRQVLASDRAALGGVWNPCAGSVTPWGTHLGSEEYEPDARSVEAARSLADVDTSYKPMALYAGFDAGAPGATLEGFRRAFDPSRYGWTTEVR